MSFSLSDFNVPRAGVLAPEGRTAAEGHRAIEGGGIVLVMRYLRDRGEIEYKMIVWKY